MNPNPSTPHENIHPRWQRLQHELANRLARLDREPCKQILLACGIGLAVALLILALAQVFPLVIVLLTIVGANLTLQLLKQVAA